MGDRRETVGQNWRVREAVGIRPRRQLARSVHIEILYRLEEQLRRLSADDNEEAAN